MIELVAEKFVQPVLDLVGTQRRLLEQRPPAADRQRVLPRQRKIVSSKVHSGQRLADAGAMAGVRPPRPHALEKIDDGGRPPGQRGIDLTLPVSGGLRTAHAAFGKMRYQ